ncbi:MAG: 4'-phosphopantetheinyl transferase superfamily protein [Burkholderiaceae bacterium]|nr:4'-phosphopantetheinyl transferase superfamily protein [Burkholderiaceae bacterium]
MSCASSLQHHEVHVWQVNLDDAVWDRFAGVLCTNEKQKAQRYRTQSLQNRYARCRSALRMILGQYANQAAAELHFDYGEFGKPTLPNHRLHFNVSHCGSQGLIAVSLHEVGIDLELIAKTNVDLPGLIDLVCHPEEKRMLAGLIDTQRSEMFYRLWTQKEAYCKMRGIGLQQTLSALHLENSANPDVLQIRGESNQPASRGFIYNLDLLEDHAISACLATDDARIATFHAGDDSSIGARPWHR